MASRYTLSVGGALNYPHPHPERTACRNATSSPFSDLEFRVWPSREAMARTIRMQERGERKWDHWRPVVPLSATEGY